MTITRLYPIVGFLGSGKTTLLKHIANNYKNEKIAIIVNEFGEQNLDIKTLEKYFQHNFEVTGGSIFCSCKSDQFIERIIDCANEDFDYLFVEGSGLANPSSLPHIMDIIDKKTNKKVILKGTIALVDPNNIEKITSTLNAAKNQLTYADLILINKMDTVSEETYLKAQNIIKYYNQTAKLLPTIYARIDKKEIEELVIQKHNINHLQTIDLHLQKETIRFQELTKEDLLRLCQSLSTYTDRIKGIVTHHQKTYYIEYINEQLHQEEILHEKENFLICLSTSKENLKANIQTLLKKKQTPFSVCSLS